MKKRFCICFLFFSVFIISLDAQVEYSVNVGGNLSHFHSNPEGQILSSNHDFGALGIICILGEGLNMGVGICSVLNDKFSIEQNIQLNQSTYHMSFDILRAIPFKFGSSYTNIKITNVDLISEINWNPIKKVRLGVGVYLGTKIHQDIQDFTSRPEGALLETVSTNLNLFEFGFTSVLSFHIRKLNIKLRYMNGLNKSLSHSYIDNDILVFDNRRKSRTLQLTLGYTF